MSGGVGSSYHGTVETPHTLAGLMVVDPPGAWAALGFEVVDGAITLDGFDATPEGGCTPFFGSLALTATKPAAVMILDINGSLCNATAPNTSKTIGGGFDFDPLTIDFTGTGSLAGTISGTTAKLKLTGAVAPAATPSVSLPM